ncbi:MAG: leucine-rich repeat domain-containing protein [Faecalibacterium sp.]|nr:leucine-rich repeat domain-containing protein [Ruminococcus sp.]MCM1391816.1 leucine-rich repeat domain-containing protein [Ruminococcus sp.]MCM1485462.1 leucine-rich repeat domain-containing protein [Faecalibacterium sp.]
MKRITKKTLSVFLAAIMLICAVPLAASAVTYSGECGAQGDNITWELNTETGVLKLDGQGRMDNYYMCTVCKYENNSKPNPWNNYKHLIQTVEISEGITHIGNCAFFECENLTSVSIPSSVEYIAGEAFEDCTALNRVNITDLSAWCNISYEDLGDGFSYTPLRYANNLYINGILTTDIVIPDDIEVISMLAFSGCTSLERITISDNVRIIGLRAFDNCKNLKNVTIGNGVTGIYDAAFYGCSALQNLIIPNSVEHIYESVFKNCTNLESVRIGDNIKTIGYSDFENCINLKDVIIGNNVSQIDGCAFKKCTSLTNIVIPDSVEIIGSSAFGDCSNLQSISIGKKLSEISRSAFRNCNELKDVYYNGTKTEMGLINIESDNQCLKNATIHYNHPHTYFSTVLTPATCTTDGEIKYTCVECDESYVETIIATGHNYYIKNIVLPICDSDGSMTHVCIACGDSYDVVLPSTNSHSDTDNNGACDNCGKQLGAVTPVPTEPTEPDADNCDCMCHQSGFAGFIWKLVKIFYQVFHTNKTCACGAAHY